MTGFARIVGLAFLLSPFTAAEAQAACHHPARTAVQAKCLSAEADRLIARTEKRVANAGRRMKGLGDHDARAFEAWLRRQQADWRERVEGQCARVARSQPGDPTAAPACRAREAERRSAELDRWLRRN